MAQNIRCIFYFIILATGGLLRTCESARVFSKGSVELNTMSYDSQNNQTLADLKDLVNSTDMENLVDLTVPRRIRPVKKASIDEPSEEEKREKKVKDLMDQLGRLVGLDKVKTRMHELVARIKFDKKRQDLGLPETGAMSMHMRFMGNPGTGKTVIARIVGELLLTLGVVKGPKDNDAVAAIRKEFEKEDAKKAGKEAPEDPLIFKEVSRADLVAEYKGQTAPKVKKVVAEAEGGVLFIDEAYSLVKSPRDSFGIEAVDTLIKEMEDKRDKVIVILAGYEKEMESFFQSNPGFKSRVPFSFYFDDYTCNELMSIGEVLLWSKKMRIGFPDRGIDLLKEPLNFECGRSNGTHLVVDPATTPEMLQSCAWLKDAAKFSTGCCENLADPDCRPRRDNGNGRAVRNILEASYREAAVRVLQEHDTSVLDTFQPAGPEMICGTWSRWANKDLSEAPPFIQNMHEHDYRCSFAMLKEEDLAMVIAPQLQAKWTRKCGEDRAGIVTPEALQELDPKNRSELMKLIQINQGLAKSKKVKSKDEKEKDALELEKECGALHDLLHESTASLLEEEKEDDKEQESFLEVSDSAEAYLNDSSFEASNYTGLRKPTSNCAACRQVLKMIAKNQKLNWERLKISCKGDTMCMKGFAAIKYLRWKHQLSDYFSGASSDANSHVCGEILCRYENDWEDRDPGCGCFTNLRMPFTRVSFGSKRLRPPLPKKPGHLNKPANKPKPGNNGPTGSTGGSSTGSKKPGKKPKPAVTMNGVELGNTIRPIRKRPKKRPPVPKQIPPVPTGNEITTENGDGAGNIIAEPVEDTRSAADKVLQGLLDMVGLDGVKDGMSQLKAMVEFDKYRKKWFGKKNSLLGQSFHMRFLGNPGTGKTVVARIVGELLLELGVIQPKEDPDAESPKKTPKRSRGRGQNRSPRKKDQKKKKKKKKKKLIFKEVSRADLVAEYVGQTAPKVKKVVESALGGVLFIDEAYSLVKNKKDGFGNEAVDTLIKEMEDKRNQIIVILAGYDDEMESFIKANPGFKSRVPFAFHFADYSCSQLMKIGGFMLKSKGMKLDRSGNQSLSKAVKFSSGCCDDIEDPACTTSRENGNGRTVRNILEGSYRYMAARVLNDTKAVAKVKRAAIDAEDQVRKYCMKKYGYESRKCLKNPAAAIKAGELIPPCRPGTTRAKWCEPFQQITGSDLDQVLELQVYERMHKACTAAEGIASEAGIEDVSKLVRMIPALNQTETETLRLMEDCAEGLATLNGAVERLTREGRQSEAEKLQQPRPMPDALTGASCGVKEVMEEMNKLVGLERVKRSMSELIMLVRFTKTRDSLLLPSVAGTSFHMRFVGNPGTGKTVVARIVGELLLELEAIERKTGSKSLRCQKETNNAAADEEKKKKKEEGEEDAIDFREVSRADLVAEYGGQTAPKVLAAIESATGGVLFIDEAYSIVKGSRDTFGIEAVDTLIKAMEDQRDKVIVILAGYEKEMDQFFSSNPGFKSRVPITFHFDDYLCQDLVKIGELRYNKMQLSLPPGDGRQRFQQLIHFSSRCCVTKDNCETDRDNGNGRTVRNLVEASARLMAMRLTKKNDTTIEDYTQLSHEDLKAMASEQVDETLGHDCVQRGMLGRLVEALNAGSLKFYLGGRAPPARPIAKLAKRIHSASKDFEGLLSGEVMDGMIRTCQNLLESFHSSIEKHTQAICGKDSPLLTSIPERLQSSSVGLSGSTALMMQHHIGEADNIIDLVENLDKYNLGGIMDYCPNCADLCREARQGLKDTEVKLKAGDLIDFVMDSGEADPDF